MVSPDGKYVLRANGDAGMQVYPIPEGEPRPIPNLESGFIPVQWSEDNSAVYGYRPGQIPLKVYKIDLASGQKTLIQELQPVSTTGVVSIAPVVVSRDGSRFAYSYYQVFSVLYVISGLR